MRREDIAQVSEIDREAFSTLWPPYNYEHELQNPLAHYVLACSEEEVVRRNEKKGFARLISRLSQPSNQALVSGSEPSVPGIRRVIGFGGFWIMAGEAHVTNIAVREAHRCRGIGERLLIFITELATELDAKFITLEVRASNVVAQRLYRKYGFEEVGLRRRYYSDNGEDGVLMSTEKLSLESFQWRFQQLREAHSRRWAMPVLEK